jgi:Replication-relaxation
MYIRLQKRDTYLLDLLAKNFLLLTREQIQLLIPRGLRRTNQRLAKLVKYKLLERREPEDRLSPSTIFYFLGEKAARVLHGYDPAEISKRRSRAKDFGDSYLRHLHLINSVQIRFRTCREEGYHFHSWTQYDNANWDGKYSLPLRPDG